MVDVSRDYEELAERAKRLADLDIARFPEYNRKKYRKTWEDRYQIHLIGMMELYVVRFGDPDKRKAIVSFLEKQFFPTADKNREEMTCHLTYDMWKSLREIILKKPEEVVSG